MILKRIEVKTGVISPKEAQTIVNRAMRFDSEIILEHKARKVNAKSIMGVMAAMFKKGDIIMAIVKGDDEAEAAAEMERVLTRG